MSSEAIVLADAIVERLNAPTTPYIFSFTAVRRIAPFASVELDELLSLNVLVFTGASRRELIARPNVYARSYKPVIAVQRRLDGVDEASRQAHVDQLVELVEQIEDELEGIDLGNMSFKGFDTEQDRDPYNPTAMQSISFFSTAIVAEYTNKED